MDDLTAAINKFPAHEFLVRRLYASDNEFKTLCEDHALAAGAASRWKDDPSRAEHYRRLADELEDEILEFIEGRHPHQVEKKHR